MKLNEKRISEIEKELGVIALFKLSKQKQYLYVKVRKSAQDKIISYPLELDKGGVYPLKCIKVSDLEAIASKPLKKDQKKRAFKGRPFAFCKECEHYEDCTLDFDCSYRDSKISQKEHSERVQGDDRFWKNGVPKKHLILCQYAKYAYAHKKRAGKCPTVECRFFVDGKCELGLNVNPL